MGSPKKPLRLRRQVDRHHRAPVPKAASAKPLLRPSQVSPPGDQRSSDHPLPRTVRHRTTRAPPVVFLQNPHTLDKLLAKFGRSSTPELQEYHGPIGPASFLDQVRGPIRSRSAALRPPCCALHSRPDPDRPQSARPDAVLPPTARLLAHSSSNWASWPYKKPT